MSDTIKPENGNCECCGKTNILVQKHLLVENIDVFDDRTDGKGDPKDREDIPVCKSCFVIPEEELEWDEEGQYQDLNERNTIWNNGVWDK